MKNLNGYTDQYSEEDIKLMSNISMYISNSLKPNELITPAISLSIGISVLITLVQNLIKEGSRKEYMRERCQDMIDMIDEFPKDNE